MSMCNYHVYRISDKAKQFAIHFISLAKIQDTGQLGFWHNIPLASDYPVIALLYESQLCDGKEMTDYEFLLHLKKRVPEPFFSYVNEESLSLDLPF